MNDKEYILTFQDTEQLCRLYMDCGLSVQEETELQYLLGKLDYSSPLIDEVRAVMGIQTSLTKRVTKNSRPGFLSRIWNRRLFIGIAASMAVILGIGVSVRLIIPSTGAEYVAYADGKRLDDRQAMIQVEADMKKAEAFMKHAAELEALEQQKYENIINIESFE